MCCCRDFGVKSFHPGLPPLFPFLTKAEYLIYELLLALYPRPLCISYPRHPLIYWHCRPEIV